MLEKKLLENPGIPVLQIPVPFDKSRFRDIPVGLVPAILVPFFSPISDPVLPYTQELVGDQLLF
jgi:hypothetical protein